MRKLLPLVAALLIWSAHSFAQGFAPNAVNWPLPQGGSTYDTVSYGFYTTSVQTISGLAGDQWTTIDMNGDGLPDLVVTGTNTGTNSSQGFGLQQNTPYWQVYLNTDTGFSATAIQWALPAGGYVDNTSTNNGFFAVSGGGFGGAGSNAWSTIDMDGDGKPDLVVTAAESSNNSVILGSGPGNGYWCVYHNTGSGFSTSPVIWKVPDGGTIATGSVPLGFNVTSQSYALYTNSQVWSTIDINGDGKPDLVVTGKNFGFGHPSIIGQGSSPHWNVYLNTGNAFADTAINWPVPATGGYYDTSQTDWSYNLLSNPGAVNNQCNTWTTMDINGDGRPDLVVTAQGNGSKLLGFAIGNNPYWQVYLNTDSGFSSTALNWALPAGGYVDDSATSYGFYQVSNTGAVYNHCNAWTTIDINGDHKPELVVTAVGNGNLPLVFGAGLNPQWQVYANTGTGFTLSATNWQVPAGGYIDYSDSLYGFYETSQSGSYRPNSDSWSVLDMNGDGTPDLVVTSAGDGMNTVEFGLPANPHWKVYLNTTSHANAIQETAAVANNFTLYPNPTGNRLYVVLSTNTTGAQLTLTDMAGRTITQMPIITGSNPVNTTGFESGIYLATIYNNGERETQKFVIQK